MKISNYRHKNLVKTLQKRFINYKHYTTNVSKNFKLFFYTIFSPIQLQGTYYRHECFARKPWINGTVSRIQRVKIVSL